jgi:hypothetical protein
MHWKLAHGHHEMMRLMVTALHHDPHKPERFEFDERLRFSRCDRELYTI